jgi:DNA-binding response OmpR family regulator
MHILLIEDDAITHQLLQTACNQQGHQLHWCETGIEGIQAVSETRFDVVLSDISLPDVNGLVVAQALKEHAAGVPLVFLTGSDSPNDQAVGESLGAADYIHKPFDPVQVLERLQALVGQTTP